MSFVRRVLLILALFCPLWVFGHEVTHMHKNCKEGILLVSFGTSYKSARESFEHIDHLVKDRWPNRPVYWAYTSGFIRKKLRKQGLITESPLAVMSHMKDDGIESIAVQSLHVIAGEEYEELHDYIDAFQSTKMAFSKVSVGRPLLGSAEDIPEVVRAMLGEVANYRAAGQSLVLMGHGTEHPADITYLATADEFFRQDAHAFLGTVEGHPRFKTVVNKLENAGVKNVLLVPFMSVAGDHANNDMAGEDEDSWKSQLESRGIHCDILLKGMGEMDAMVDLWLDHLQNAIDKLECK